MATPNRLRSLLHELADELADLAERAVEEAANAPPPPPSASRQRRAPLRRPPTDGRPVDELARAKARRALKGLGYVETER